jgi:hypothetical protein
MLAFAMPKYVLFIIFHYKKRSCIKKVDEIVTNMQKNEITWKIVILQKIRKKSINLELIWLRNTSFKF